MFLLKGTKLVPGTGCIRGASDCVKVRCTLVRTEWWYTLILSLPPIPLPLPLPLPLSLPLPSTLSFSLFLVKDEDKSHTGNVLSYLIYWFLTPFHTLVSADWSRTLGTFWKTSVQRKMRRALHQETGVMVWLSSSP